MSPDEIDLIGRFVRGEMSKDALRRLQAKRARQVEIDDMCPNCVTPWKCNGPHLSEQTPAARLGAEDVDEPDDPGNGVENDDHDPMPS